VKKLGGTIEDTHMVDGLVFAKNKPSQSAGGPTKMEKASIGLLQFCLSSPKTDVENNIVITDYHKMEKIMKEERMYFFFKLKLAILLD
jgi:T-complex protein 1 subunit delta